MDNNRCSRRNVIALMGASAIVPLTGCGESEQAITARIRDQEAAIRKSAELQLEKKIRDEEKAKFARKIEEYEQMRSRHAKESLALRSQHDGHRLLLEYQSSQWNARQLNDFLSLVTTEGMLSLKKAAGIVEQNEGTEVLVDRLRDARDVLKHMDWLSRNVLSYQFSDELNIDYHSMVDWVAKQMEIPTAGLASANSTFLLERQIQLQMFGQIWDNLDEDQRIELLIKIEQAETDLNSVTNDKTAMAALSTREKAAIVVLSASGAIAALSATVAFSGFAFYTTMSVTISSVAGFFGVTLPFAVFTSASSLVAMLSGPVGWAIAAVAIGAGIWLAGGPNAQKVAQLVFQIHSIKIAMLLSMGVSLDTPV